MSRRVVCFLLSLSLAFPLLATAQTESADLALGIRQVEEGDLSTAVITLDTVIQRLSKAKGAEKDLATAHLYLGMAHLGLSQWERANAEMREAWRNNKGMKLDPRKFPPRVIQAYDAARSEGANAKPAAAPATPPPAKTPTDAGNAKKGGGSKALLVVGGLALAGGGVALAGGGGSSTTTPSTTKAPQLVGSGTFSVPASTATTLFCTNNIPVTVTGPGQLDFTINWTLSNSRFFQAIYSNSCSAPTFGSNVNQTVTTRPATLTTTVTAAGAFCAFACQNVLNAPQESVSYQLVFRPQ